MQFTNNTQNNIIIGAILTQRWVVGVLEYNLIWLMIEKKIIDHNLQNKFRCFGNILSNKSDIKPNLHFDGVIDKFSD